MCGSWLANGRSFEFMVETALGIAKQWRWGEEKAKLLVGNLKQYYQSKGPFVGAQANGLDWWECLPISSTSYPLKTLAINILSIVPHSADVERLFSDLGSTQSVKRCNLSVETFETLGKLCANYAYHLYKKAQASGKPIHRRHAHMHTRNETGINKDLVSDLEATFTWVPPLATDTGQGADHLQGPESISLEELDAAFDELEKELASTKDSEENGEKGVLDGDMYDYDELSRVDQGLAPKGFEEEVSILNEASTDRGWNVGDLMSSL